jgi:hypothetical protein
MSKAAARPGSNASSVSALASLAVFYAAQVMMTCNLVQQRGLDAICCR